MRCRVGPQRPPPAAPRSILVLGYNAIGDLIFFLPVLEGLRRQWPRARIVFLADGPPLIDEIAPQSGFCDEVWFREWEYPPHDRAADIRRRIRAASFDWVVLSLASPAHDYQGSLGAVPLRAGHCRPLQPSRQGWAWPRRLWWQLRYGLVVGEFARRAILNRKAWVPADGEHALLRNLRLLDVLAVPRPPLQRPAFPLTEANRAFAAQALASLDPGKKKVAVHLGPPCNPYFKIWPAERFAAVCRSLAAQMPADIIAVGSEAETASLQRARQAFPGLHSRVGECSFLDSCALIAGCDLFLSNDTGPAKAAMALGVPTVTVFGPTDPGEVGVIWDPQRHLEVRTGIECSPCVRLGMAKAGPGVINYSNCGHHNCLQQLDADAVLAAIRAKYPALFSA